MQTGGTRCLWTHGAEFLPAPPGPWVYCLYLPGCVYSTAFLQVQPDHQHNHLIITVTSLGALHRMPESLGTGCQESALSLPPRGPLHTQDSLSDRGVLSTWNWRTASGARAKH